MAILDITIQPWYVGSATATENMENMREYVRDNYDALNLSDNEVAALNQFTSQLNVMVNQTADAQATFYSDRDSAITSAMQALQQDWQTAEDAAIAADDWTIRPL